MKTTDRIFELVNSCDEPVTLADIQAQLELTAGIVSGSLASLCRSGRLLRDRREVSNVNGPKMRWVYWAKKD
jgi:hypothetical protein